jgi:hypothetical protein
MHEQYPSSSFTHTVSEDAPPTWPMSWLAPACDAPTAHGQPHPSKRDQTGRAATRVSPARWQQQRHALAHRHPGPAPHSHLRLPPRGDRHRKESSPRRAGPPPRPHLSAGPRPHTHPASMSPLGEDPPAIGVAWRRAMDGTSCGRQARLVHATATASIYASLQGTQPTERRRAVQAKHSHASCSLLLAIISRRLVHPPASIFFLSIDRRRPWR